MNQSPRPRGWATATPMQMPAVAGAVITLPFIPYPLRFIFFHFCSLRAISEGSASRRTGGLIWTERPPTPCRLWMNLPPSSANSTASMWNVVLHRRYFALSSPSCPIASAQSVHDVCQEGSFLTAGSCRE